MKKILPKLLFLPALAMLCASCNDEWKDEQYERFISFKAPLNSKGVSRINVRYKADGKTTYQLPVIVSGSTTNDQDITVHIALDSDTLNVLNTERFQSRTDLYYKQLEEQFYEFPETATIKAGENVALLNIDLSLKDIDLVEKWVLPLTVVNNPSYGYAAHPRKHYRKALLRVMPFNDYSGLYSATALRSYLQGEESGNPIVKNEAEVYVVDEDEVFFYAGAIDEDRNDRDNYKVIAQLDTATNIVALRTDNPNIDLRVNSTPKLTIEETMDVVRPYLLHRYVTISDIDYNFSDYTSVPGVSIRYTVRGSIILERKINTQIPDEDQAIEW
jgi:hypothetical protein